MTDKSSEASTTAALLTTAAEALEQFHDVHVDDDGALTFRHGDVPCAVQAMQLAEGLAVLSLTCVVAWDLQDSPSLASSAAERAGQGLFGTLGVVHTDRGMDVTLRYTFPAAGLTAAALGTLLMLVVSTASQLRGELLAEAAG
ncbi:MAG TPA: YbjN domain-containing protein [Pseudonocardiaceae bacterium]|nr:YbjN domain-containing protein [Pseudonocardiaceae bacterium]